MQHSRPTFSARGGLTPIIKRIYAARMSKEQQVFVE
jgi:hypothetical protein